jgi:hypothetical protein
MKKKKIFLSLMLVILSFMPTISAFAYTDGLINGKSMNIGSNVNTIITTTMNLTDNNQSTMEVLDAGANKGTAWYEFSSPITVTDYQLKSLSGVRVVFYDSTNTFIYNNSSPVISGTKTSITAVANVKKVAVFLPTSSTNVYEFDVFGSSPTPVVKTDITNLQIINVTQTSATVSYQKPTGYSGVTYDYARIYKDGSFISNVAATGSSYNLGGLSPNTTYTIKVTARYSDGSETTGLTKTFTTLDTIPPANVSGLTASNITDTGFNVSWVKPSDSDYDKAEIYLDDVLEGTVSSTDTQSYSFSDLVGDTSYSVKIVSIDKVGNKSNGSTITVKTDPIPDTTAPANVTNLVGIPTHNSIRLSWTNPQDQDFAEVKVYEDGIYKKSVTAAEGTNAFFDNLNPETEYTFKVTSVDTTGNESIGTSINVTTLPLPVVKDIQNLDKDVKYDRVRLSWELPEGEYFHHVNIYRKVIEEEESFLQSLFSLGSINVSAADTTDGYKPMFETNGTYWTDLTVDPDTGYEYKLTSENTDGRESTGVTAQVVTPQEPKPEITGAEFTQSANGDYIVSWQEPTTGSIKLFVGEEEYKTIQANLGTYTIPKSDLKLTTLGDPDIKIQPITDRGTEGGFVANPKMNLPFSVKDVVETGNGLLWLVGPFILLALAFLLVPKFRNLILAAFRGKGNLTDTAERRSADLKLDPKEETVRSQKEPRELRTPRIKADKAEREVRIGREPRQVIREPRTPRVSKRGR